MLQTKRRDLREKVLLRDTEDKLRVVRTSTEVEESKGTQHSFLCFKKLTWSRITGYSFISEIYVHTQDTKLTVKFNSSPDNVSKDEDEISEVQEDSPVSPSVFAQNEEELPASSQSQRSSTTSSASAEVFEDGEYVHDKDHVTSSGTLESPWENQVTLELQTDDFLLDGGCEVVSEEQGSLLEEVLSSLKGPLVSGLVLESEATVEQMEVGI